MSQRFKIGLAKATALTRAGKLADATALIQSMLTGAPSAADRAGTDTAPPDAGASDDAHVIEGTYTPLDETPASPAGQKNTSGSSEQAEPRRPRSPLSETLERLSRDRRTAEARAKPDLGKDARFSSHSYSGPEGGRDYMLFLPDTAADGLRPVVLMLHGCTQSPADFAAGTQMNALAAARGIIVIYPEQPAGANMNKCWNWFRTGDQQRGRGEPAILAGLVNEVVALHQGDPSRVYVAGLSAGGATAAILGQAYGDVFAAVGVHSGLAAGAADDVQGAFAAMRNSATGSVATGRDAKRGVPTIVFHGTADSTVNVKNAEAVAVQARGGNRGKGQVTKDAGQNGRSYQKSVWPATDDVTNCEIWLIEKAGHAWSGGSSTGSYTDPAGPDASAEMLRFFLQHQLVTR